MSWDQSSDVVEISAQQYLRSKQNSKDPIVVTISDSDDSVLIISESEVESNTKLDMRQNGPNEDTLGLVVQTDKPQKAGNSRPESGTMPENVIQTDKPQIRNSTERSRSETVSETVSETMPEGEKGLIERPPEEAPQTMARIKTDSIEKPLESALEPEPKLFHLDMPEPGPAPSPEFGDLSNDLKDLASIETVIKKLADNSSIDDMEYSSRYLKWTQRRDDAARRIKAKRQDVLGAIRSRVSKRCVSGPYKVALDLEKTVKTSWARLRAQGVSDTDYYCIQLPQPANQKRQGRLLACIYDYLAGEPQDLKINLAKKTTFIPELKHGADSLLEAFEPAFRKVYQETKTADSKQEHGRTAIMALMDRVGLAPAVFEPQLNLASCRLPVIADFYLPHLASVKSALECVRWIVDTELGAHFDADLHTCVLRLAVAVSADATLFHMGQLALAARLWSSLVDIVPETVWDHSAVVRLIYQLGEQDTVLQMRLWHVVDTAACLGSQRMVSVRSKLARACFEHTLDAHYDLDADQYLQTVLVPTLTSDRAFGSGSPQMTAALAETKVHQLVFMSHSLRELPLVRTSINIKARSPAHARTELVRMLERTQLALMRQLDFDSLVRALSICLAILTAATSIQHSIIDED